MNTLVQIVLVLAGTLFFIRLLRGPSLTDRIVSVDGMIITGASSIIVQAVHTGDGTYLPIVVVLTLVGFIGTSVVARFIEGRGG